MIRDDAAHEYYACAHAIAALGKKHAVLSVPVAMDTVRHARAIFQQQQQHSSAGGFSPNGTALPAANLGDGEWLYQVGQDASQNPFTLLNEVFERAAAAASSIPSSPVEVAVAPTPPEAGRLTLIEDVELALRNTAADGSMATLSERDRAWLLRAVL